MSARLKNRKRSVHKSRKINTKRICITIFSCVKYVIQMYISVQKNEILTSAFFIIIFNKNPQLSKSKQIRLNAVSETHMFQI